MAVRRDGIAKSMQRLQSPVDQITLTASRLATGIGAGGDRGGVFGARHGAEE
jgi:hypothetical protein